jgi:hypothetical protein
MVEGQPIGEHFDDWCHFCYPSNLTGQPAMSVPMGTAEHGLPVGLQIIGPRFGDAAVLRAAAAWERIAPWPAPPDPASADGPPRAGQRLPDGTTVRRAYVPTPGGELVVETEPSA